MSIVYYVTEGAKVKCSMGLSGPKELGSSSHGVFRMNGKNAVPVLNAKDKTPENIDVPGGSYVIPSFTRCKCIVNRDIPLDNPELEANPALMTEIVANANTLGTCKCRGEFPADWINAKTQTVTGGHSTLTSDCVIVCSKGMGVVSIVGEADFKGGNSSLVKFSDWNTMKETYKGTVTYFLKENKPKGSPVPKKWFEKGGTLEIETLEDGSQIWRYTSAKGDTVPYINNQIKFPKQYMFPDEDIAEFSIGIFTGDREKDRRAALEFLKSEGYDEIPEGYVLHHDYENGKMQLIREDIHATFTHYGGNYYNI